MTENELIGVRDPHGFRPLCLGKIDDAWVLASETCALDLIHAKFVRDVEPGEIVIINKDGLTSIQAFPEQERRAFCIFEYVYFARPDSTIANRNVYKVRVEMGRQLAREYPDRGRRRRARAGQRQLRGAGLFARIGHPVRDGVRAQSLRRTQLSPAVAAHPRLRRARETEPHRRTGAKANASSSWTIPSCAARPARRA